MMRVVRAIALVFVAAAFVGFAVLVKGSAEPSVERVVARYAGSLKAIGAAVRLPINQGPSQPQDALPRLATVKEDVQTAELIARDFEQQLATKSSGCIFAKAAGDANTSDAPIASAASASATARSEPGAVTLMSGTTDGTPIAGP